MKKLYPIFVNFNSGNQLYNGVKSVLRSPSIHRIIIVDNNSKDESLEKLKKIKTNKLLIIKNKKNEGFYRALNMALKKAIEMKADMVMPLDFDLDFSFDFITRLFDVKADMVAPALKSKMNGKWFYDYGGRINWMKGTQHHILSASIRRVGEVVAGDSNKKSKKFDYISGGCTIIKLDVVKKIGFFDEDYFVYWGDADYALHAKENGFRVVMDGNTIVHHKLEINSQTKNFRKLKISFFDNLTFIKKRVKWYFKPIAYLNILFLSLKTLVKTLN